MGESNGAVCEATYEIEHLRDGFAGLVVSREPLEHVRLPGPVLHDLRRRLDEVSLDARAREPHQLGFRQRLMEDVAELVEQGEDLLGEVCRLEPLLGHGDLSRMRNLSEVMLRSR